VKTDHVIAIGVVALLLTPGYSRPQEASIAREIEHELKDRFLSCWYPRAVDREFGGFFSTFDAGWNPVGAQEKGVVNQSRHIWTASEAARFFPGDSAVFREAAVQGFSFLRSKMWDSGEGGFFQMLNRRGDPETPSGTGNEKRAYGNAFGIFACAAYFRLTGDSAALSLAKRTFLWLDGRSRDPVHGGYFQNLDRTGRPIPAGASSASGFDGATAGLKDYNSSIHLLEAFTALYAVQPDPVLRERIVEMALLIRDKMVDPRGFLRLFFRPDWTPLSYRDSLETIRSSHTYEDHVSFGHDMETAYLLLEANEVLGGVLGDSVTLDIARKMVDHSMKNGWDLKNGGFFESGYYFKGHDTLSIIDDSKSWWVQAEALHVLLMMSVLYPEDLKYRNSFEKQWAYMKRFLFDYDHGGWYEMGLDTSPEFREKLKGHQWKAAYHETRALIHCLQLLERNRWNEVM
jgi:cellobiose epimerase